jgi:hypothetical protein
VTIEEQAQVLEASYAKFHRMRTQKHRTEEDRREALATLKNHLTAAERTLRLPPTGSDPAYARSKLMLWSEMTRLTLTEMGEDVVTTDT